MSHSILTKSNRASCNGSLRATADILLTSMGLGTGPWQFNPTLPWSVSSSFLPYLLSPLLTVFGSGLVRAEAAVNTKKDARDQHEGASHLPYLVPKGHTVLPRLTSCIPSSLQLHCWICCKGQICCRASPAAGAASQPGACSTHNTRNATTAKSRGAPWVLLPSCCSPTATWCHRQVFQQTERMLLL